MNQRRSIEEIGLALPLGLWLVLIVAYLGSTAVIFFASGAEHQFIRGLALAVVTFVSGVYFAFKFPLWVPRNKSVGDRPT